MPRDVSHFDALARLLELERRAERERFQLDQAQRTLAEREEAGLCFLDLEAVDEQVGLAGRFLVTLERPDKRPLRHGLYPGAQVEVRPRKADVDSPPVAMVSRGGRGRIQLAFEREPPPFVREGRLRLDLMASDVTFNRARAALQTVAKMDHGQVRRTREVLLGNEPARFDAPPPLEPTRPLNPEQRDAVTKALSAKDFFLVHGPPGTGKSTVLAEVAVQSARQGLRLLCTAASNAAVDHLLELCLDQGLRALRIGHPARVLERLQAHTLDVRVEEHPDRVLSRELFDEAFELLGYARKQRIQGRSRERFGKARASRAEADKIFDEARALERKALRSVLDSAQVLCCTLSSLDSYTVAQERFDLVLLDEATQAHEPLSLAAFTRAPRVVLAGDPMQLPPTVLSVDAAKQGLARSLFERLLEDHGEDVKRMLAEQHRMHADIMAFPSAQMYGGKLRAHPAVAARTLAEVLRPDAREGVDAPPFLFLDTAGKGFDETETAADPSRSNPGEAALVVARVKELLAAGLSPQELGVLSPYAAQAARIREALGDTAAGVDQVEVDTIDAFQGREKDAILLTLVRSNPVGQLGFLEDLRRLNVALTRARRHLFIVGDGATLASHPVYARLVEHAQAQGGYRSAWEWPDPTLPE